MARVHCLKRIFLRRRKRNEDFNDSPFCHGSFALYVVPFASADIKALYSLMHALAKPEIADWRYVGVRCNVDLGDHPDEAETDVCRDANAGAFHLALANEVGLHKRGFIIDRTHGEVIWNRPVYGFESAVTSDQGPSAGAAQGTVRELVVKT